MHEGIRSVPNKPKPQPRKSSQTDNPDQSRRFIEAARELGADQSEEAFNEALRKVARAPAAPKKPKGRKPGPDE